mmetsp:Transcript_27975/g.37183  ORF Transcript_27975/g.37183 Transcript_27975/m.37183 type:complete len:263 (-) Transcript_27975:845-1633(-)
MKLLSTTIILSSFLNCALAQSLRRSLMGQQYNYQVVGDPETSNIKRNKPVGYSITFTNHWTEKNHPYNYPSKDPHWSDFVYASHSRNYEMWRDRRVASKGIENIAEEGVTKDLVSEINSEIKEETVLDQVMGAWIRKATEGATSSPKEDLCVDKSHPFVSGIGMLAPSPDWFSGVYKLRLFDRETRFWYQKIEVNVYAWDAGTEGGNDYSFKNDPKNENISPFKAGSTEDAVFVSVDKDNNNLQVLPVGTLTFELQESSKCG